jgi:BirA family biotin operon repressor/biotin-[acetyl-CoA-carboxylase] ligase
MTNSRYFHSLPRNLAHVLRNSTIGRSWHHVSTTGSTNDDLKVLARDSAEEGLVLSTDEQTQGRGRRGRSWSAPAGSSVLLSTLLRPTWLQAQEGAVLTMLAAVACAEAIEEATMLSVALKWPNDLMVDGRKTGGILLETELAQSTLAWAIIGIGINVDWDPSTDPTIGATATSLSRALGHPVGRAEIVFPLLRRLDVRYAQLKTEGRTELFQEWRTRLDTLGQPVDVEEDGHVIHGIAEDVTPEGALILRTPDGATRLVTAGNVSIRPTMNDQRPMEAVRRRRFRGEL